MNMQKRKRGFYVLRPNDKEDEECQMRTDMLTAIVEAVESIEQREQLFDVAESTKFPFPDFAVAVRLKQLVSRIVRTHLSRPQILAWERMTVLKSRAPMQAWFRMTGARNSVPIS
jgi:hypothetical protein